MAVAGTTTANIATITPIERRVAVPSTADAIFMKQRTIVSAAGLLVALIVAGLAVPRCMAYGEVTSWRSFSLIAPRAGSAANEIDTVLAAYRAAAAVVPGDADLQMRRARLALSAASSQSGNDAAFGAETIDALHSAIAASPDQASGWALLAYAGNRFGLASVPVMPSLRLSYILGPYEGNNSRLRVAVALAHWDEMPEEQKFYLRRDVLNLWNDGTARQLLADLYLASSFPARAFVRTVFPSEAELSHFDQILRDTIRHRAEMRSPRP
jgi:hypothetical protein